MKKLIIILGFLPILALGITAAQKEALQANIKVLEQEGLPTPDSGVQLVASEEIRSKKEKVNKLGYINKNSERAIELRNIKNIIKEQSLKEKNKYKPTESYMRFNVKDIRFAYSYIGVPENEIIEFYGIAPAGTYVKEPQSGWTGAVEFFKTSFGICAYTENNIYAAHGAAFIDEKAAKDDVNGKITLIDIEGNESSGFLYNVNWFDNIFNRNLECVNKDFSSSIREATIELAKKIDNA